MLSVSSIHQNFALVRHIVFCSQLLSLLTSSSIRKYGYPSNFQNKDEITRFGPSKLFFLTLLENSPEKSLKLFISIDTSMCRVHVVQAYNTNEKVVLLVGWEGFRWTYLK